MDIAISLSLRIIFSAKSCESEMLSKLTNWVIIPPAHMFLGSVTPVWVIMGDAVPMPKPKEPWSAETVALCVVIADITAIIASNLFDVFIIGPKDYIY